MTWWKQSRHCSLLPPVKIGYSNDVVEKLEAVNGPLLRHVDVSLHPSCITRMEENTHSNTQNVENKLATKEKTTGERDQYLSFEKRINVVIKERLP